MAGLTVLDLSQSVAGNFCARLFADNGARVLLVEPPGGSAMRQAAPLTATEEPGLPVSYLFRHLNAGKRPAAPAAAADVAEMAAAADVVVIDEATDATAVMRAGARLVCQLTPFGAADEWAGQQAGELIFQALSGTMHENGSPDRKPLYGVGHRASYAAGVIGYIQAVAVLLSGSTDVHVIDVSIAETAASLAFNRITQYSYNGSVLGRDARETQRTIVRAADGWLGLFVDDRRWAPTCRSLGLDDLIDDPRWSTLAARAEHWPEFERELERRTAGRPVADLLAAAQQAKAVAARSIRLTELRSHPQLQARRWWPPADAAGGQQLGPMFRFSATPQRRGPDTAPPSSRPMAAARPAATGPASGPAAAASRRGRLPLAGLRVADFTNAWAGPMATRLLATLGADVVKVEGPARLDDWRGPAAGGPPDRYPDFDPAGCPYDRHFQFNTQNHDKRSLILDLKNPAGAAVARRLIASADVVIANFSVGALDRLGLGWADVSRENPAAVMVEMPAYGAGGPISGYVAYGPSMELMSGMAGVIGYGDGKPVTTGPACLDPIGGLNGAAAALTALFARTWTGRGQHVEVAQTEAAMHFIGEQILAAADSGQDRVPDGNRVDWAAPHDAYPCAGPDSWVAVAAYDDAQFARLSHALGLPEQDWSGTLQGRLAHADELDAAISAVTSGLTKHAAAARLRAAGVPASAVLTARDVHADEFLARRGLAYEMDHPAAGRHRYQGLPLHISGYDLRVRRPAPVFGEHNDVVLDELGLSDSEIADLRRLGAVADQPRQRE